MAAPTPSTRIKPTGKFLKRGHKILVVIAADTDIDLWEKTVKPPGLDGGEPIDTTTQFNDVWRTFVPEALITMTPMTFKAAFDPAVYDQLVAVLNLETVITVPFPDHSTVCFWGYLSKAEPDEQQEKEHPTISVTIVPTNEDPVTRGEESPVYTPGSGTA